MQCTVSLRMPAEYVHALAYSHQCPDSKAHLRMCDSNRRPSEANYVADADRLIALQGLSGYRSFSNIMSCTTFQQQTLETHVRQHSPWHDTIQHVSQQLAVMDVDAVQDSKPRDVAEVPDVEIANEIRHVKLPVGWEGLSLKLHGGKLLVSEVPKACFSSKSFESGAKPQVEGVFEGDEIISMNGEPPSRVEERILSKGDSWNACSVATPPHSIGSKGKSLSYLVVDANLMVFFVTFVLNGAPVELTLLAAGAVACFTGLLEPGALFAGCASDAVVTLALLFPIMKAMGDTGIPETLIGYVLGKTKELRPMLFVMFTSVALLSGFFNNTPIVIMMIPVLQSLCQRRGLPLRTLLMPLSFAAQAGGSLTLMGSSLNFVAQEVFAGKGYHIAFFTFSLGGAIIVCFGAVVTALLGPRILTSTASSSHSEAEPSGRRQTSAKDHFPLLLRVQSASPLIGACVTDVGLHRIPGVQAIVSLLRGDDGSMHSPDSLSTIELQQFSDMLLQSMQEVSERREYKGDLLQIACSAAGASAESRAAQSRAVDACFVLSFRNLGDVLHQVRRVKGLELSNEAEVHLLGAQRRSRSLCEVTIKDDLVGSNIDVTRWRKELRCAVLSVKGVGQEESDPTRRPHPCSFHNYTLQAGNVVLVEAFRDMVGSDVWLDHFGVARVEPNSAPPRSGQKADLLRAAFIVVGLIAVISLASLGYKRLSMPLMSIIFLCCIIAVKGLKMEEAYGEVNGVVLLTIVGALVLGKSMEASCLANCVGQLVVVIARPLGHTAVSAGLYCATIALGQFLNSAANVAIMGQVALSVAEEMQMPVGEVAMIVTYAASACYMAPYGYQTNTLVMAAGGYDWADFIRFGGMLQALHMFDSPPCVACDFQRRRQALGLDVALQMWLRAVKREIRFTLAVKSTGIELPQNGSNSATSLSPASQGNGDKASSVVELKGSSTGGTLRKMKSLDELTKERQPVQKDFLKKGKGKGKVKGKGKGKSKKPSGPHLPRTRVSKEPLRGEVLEWKSKFGWIKASNEIDHPMAEKRQGKIYINVIDLITRKSLAPGEVCEFHLYSDASGLGAEECWVVGDEDWSEWTEGEAMEGSGDWEWTDDDWNRWQSSDGSSEVQAQDV
eukprot:s5152_g4.t3